MVKRYLTYGLNELTDGAQPDVMATEVLITGRVSNFGHDLNGGFDISIRRS